MNALHLLCMFDGCSVRHPSDVPLHERVDDAVPDLGVLGEDTFDRGQFVREDAEEVWIIVEYRLTELFPLNYPLIVDRREHEASLLTFGFCLTLNCLS